MGLRLAQIAEMLNGQLFGPDDIFIREASTISEAEPGDLTFATSQKQAESLASCQASAALVGVDFCPAGIPYIQVADPAAGFAEIVRHFRPREARSVGIQSGAIIDSSAQIGDDVDVHAGATIAEDVRIGPGCRIHPGVTIGPGCRIGKGVELFPQVVLYENTVVGDGVVIHSGSVIGAYGFGYETVDGRHIRTAQLGHVEIGNDVEIGAGTTIDRGSYGPTSIGEGTKIDNQVMIAHNCRIGRHNIICSQVGIAGSSTTGDYVVLAGQVGIKDHVHIGTGATLGAQSGVMHDVPAGEVFFGTPAIRDRQQMQAISGIWKLHALRGQFRRLQRQVAELEQQADSSAPAAKSSTANPSAGEIGNPNKSPGHDPGKPASDAA